MANEPWVDRTGGRKDRRTDVQLSLSEVDRLDTKERNFGTTFYAASPAPLLSTRIFPGSGWATCPLLGTQLIANWRNNARAPVGKSPPRPLGV